MQLRVAVCSMLRALGIAENNDDGGDGGPSGYSTGQDAARSISLEALLGTRVLEGMAVEHEGQVCVSCVHVPRVTSREMHAILSSSSRLSRLLSLV